MTNPWTWFKNLFRSPIGKKNEEALRKVEERRRVSGVSGSGVHGNRTVDVISDIGDNIATVVLVDAALDLFKDDSAPQEVPPITSVPEPVVDNGTQWGESDTTSWGTPTSSSVDDESALTTFFSGVGETVSNFGSAIGDALSD